MPNTISTSINNNMATSFGCASGLTTAGISAGGSGILTTNGTTSSQFALSNSANTTWSNNITSTGPMIATDFIMGGVSLKENFERINERLAILVPDPAKLEKFAALKASYEQYKLLEKLCTEP